jgi:hypothetical protein
MHIDTMSDAVARFFEEANVLQWRKNADYHPDKVAMLEILQTAFETGVTVEQDLWGRVRKQFSALRRFVIDGHTESEPPRSRMIDIAVYMGMMSFWIDNRMDVLRDAYEFVRDNRPCESPRIEDGLTCDRCQFLAWLGNEYGKTRKAATN